MKTTSIRSPSPPSATDTTRPAAPPGRSSPSTMRATRVITSVPGGSGTAAGSRSARPPRRSAMLVLRVLAVARLDAEAGDHALEEAAADAGALGGARDVAADQLEHR